MRQFIKTRLRRSLVALPVSAALVVVLMPLSGCSPKPAPVTARPAAAAPAPRVPTGSEKFATASDSLATSLESAERAFAHGSTDATAVAAMRAFAKDLPELDRGVKADFAKTRTILAKIKSPAKDAIQARVERTYAKRQAALASRLAAVTSAESTAAMKSAIASTAKYLDSVTPEEPYQPLGTNLPHRIVDAKAGPPILGAKISPAYAPNTPGAEPSKLPVTPTAADTSTTVEVQFSPEITALVASLGADPVRMYEYVRNTIDFEPYYGSRKGATETLLEGSGNDIDTASLLIALYRKAGIPARYVSGVVDVPIEKAMNWVGVETPEAAAKLFASGGTPTTSLISGGKVKTLRIEHTWAEVYVNYEDYRGTGARAGEKVWVPLDGSVKGYTPPGAARGLFGSLVSQPSIPATDPAAIRQYVAEATATIASWAETHTAGELDVLVPHDIIADHTGVLPIVLPWRAIATSEFRQCASRDTVSIALGGGEPVVMPLSTAASATIQISYTLPDETALELVRQYGSALSVPAYLAEMMPVLFVDGSVVATGPVANVGVAQDVDVEIASSNGWTSDAGRSVFVGGIYGLTFDAGRMSGGGLGAAKGQLQDAIQRLDTEEIETQDLTRPLLGCVGRAYFTQLDAVTSMMADAAGVVDVHAPSALFASIEIAPRLVMGLPISASPSGLSLDVRTNDHLTVAQSEVATQAVAQFNGIAGPLSSLLESEVLSEFFGGQAVSTTAVFAEASRRGVEFLRLDPGNIETELPRLEASLAFKQRIAGIVHDGRVVVLPEKSIPMGSWDGHAWLEVDPETGDTGYMIDAMAGGLLEIVANVIAACADAPAVAWAAEHGGNTFNNGTIGLRVNSFVTTRVTQPIAFGLPVTTLCALISVVVLPVVATIERYYGDLNRDDLSEDQKIDRLVTTYSVFFGYSVAFMAIGYGLGFLGMGPVGAGMVVSVAAVLVQLAWSFLSEELLHQYGA